MGTSVLSQVFLAQVGASGAARERLAEIPTLETVLAAIVGRAETARPEIQIDRTIFLRHLAERLPDDVDPIEALQGVHAEDLYLACACVRGQPEALRAFDQQFLARLALRFDRQETAPSTIDEIKQGLRARLLVPSDGKAPRISGYTGQGPLGAWLRMAAVRLNVDLHRQQKEFLLMDSGRPLRLASPELDPEIALLKKKYRPELEQAFRTTLESLSPRERTVLRLQFIDGMPAHAIAKIYRVSKRTVERWISAALARIKEETRRLLADKFGVAQSQFDTLVKLVQSQVDVSVHEFLERTED